MTKKKANEESVIDKKICEKKIREICSIIDGVNVPEATYILGAVIMTIVESCMAGGNLEVRDFVLDSLDSLYEDIEDIDSLQFTEGMEISN